MRRGGRERGRESGRRGKEGVTEEERGNNYVMKKQSEKIGQKEKGNIRQIEGNKMMGGKRTVGRIEKSSVFAYSCIL